VGLGFLDAGGGGGFVLGLGSEDSAVEETEIEYALRFFVKRVLGGVVLAVLARGRGGRVWWHFWI